MIVLLVPPHQMLIGQNRPIASSKEHNDQQGAGQTAVSPLLDTQQGRPASSRGSAARLAAPGVHVRLLGLCDWSYETPAWFKSHKLV